MKDILYLLNHSEFSDRLIYPALRGLDRIRPLEIIPIANPEKMLKRFIGHNYDLDRKQVHYRNMLEDISRSKFVAHTEMESGKIFFLKEDLYSDGLNWCFGGFTPAAVGLGYVLISSARVDDDFQARDIIRHELGHMFGAPSGGRKNTYDSLGLHCSNNLCVMQQKLSVPESIRYAHIRRKTRAPAYCRDCIKDIVEYSPNLSVIKP